MNAENNIEYLESVLIGTVLSIPDTYPVAADILKETDFVSHCAKKIWLEICANWNVSDNSGLQSLVYMALTSKGEKDWFFSATRDLIPVSSSVSKIAEQIHQEAKTRRIRAEVGELLQKSSAPGFPADWILNDLTGLYQREMGNIDEDVAIAPAIERFNKTQGENAHRDSIGMDTGFRLFKEDYIFYQPGHFWVIGAWTSVGKTAMMIESIVRFFVENQAGRVAVFSTEMTECQNISRILANRTGVNANVILSGKMLDMHQRKVDSEKEWLKEKTLFIYTKTRSCEEISRQCRKLKHGCGVDLVFIDFIQNVEKEGYREKYAMMSQIALDLQALAHELECTIICLSQIPNHAGREDSGILEFKGAGEIAAACDLGAIMKREKSDHSKLLFDIRKNRHGKCGKYIFQFVNGWTRIEEVEAII